MILSLIEPLLAGTDRPVLLLEGTRNLPDHHRQTLTTMGRRLARTFPNTTFRSGNAPGADEAFALGAAAVPGSRLELILPTPGMGRARRPATATCFSLHDLPDSERRHLAEASTRATPDCHRLFDLFLNGPTGNPAHSKSLYLVRDALKVLGSPGLGRPPATAALFYIDPATPTGGGTGHTIRLCQQNQIPVFTQEEWMEEERPKAKAQKQKAKG